MSAHSDAPPAPPALVAEDALDRGEVDELVFTRAEFDALTKRMWRRLAAAADSEEISGRSTKLEVMSYYCGQRSLDEY